MNGVIWSKTQKTFVPISSVPEFARLQEERLRQSRALEIHNFQLQNLTLTSFQEPGFLEFYDDDTKITGICGDLWTLLSDALNFTLYPVRSNETGLGASEEDVVFTQGLLGVISRHETFAIPKVEINNVRRIATDFTIPLWINRQKFYIPHKIVHDSTWMTKVFSWEVWCFILMMYLLLSVYSFWSQTVISRIRNNCERSTINDHIFYYFGMICNQSYMPKILLGRSRILELSFGFFCSVLFMAFGALLFVHITKKNDIVPPFHNLNSLITDTSYNVIALEGSIGDIVFENSRNEFYARMTAAKRVVIVYTIEEMYKRACIEDKTKYTVLQGEDEYKTRNQLGCRLIPVGESLLKVWIASGIEKNFKYKRTIDIGILKLMESGLWDRLMQHWFDKKFEDINNVKMEAIQISQIHLVILMMCSGIIIAFIIFIIENIIYCYRH